MDLRYMLNEEPVDPTPPSRRFSQSQTSISAVESPLQNGSYFAGIKRPMSSSTVGEEPSPKKVMVKLDKKRRKDKPIWAQKWTEQWQQQYGSKNGTVHKASPAPQTPSNGTSIAPPPLPTRLSSQHSSFSSHPPPNSANQSTPADSTRPEPTYLNVYPQDELAKTIADFIYSEVIAPGWLEGSNDAAEVEIEAKLGKIIDKNTNDRLQLPVRHECVLNDTRLNIAFRSSMTQAQHRIMNEHLNKAVQESLPRKDSGAPPSGVRRQPMGYKHLYELDRFFQLDSKTYRDLPPRLQSLVAQMKQKPRIRVTWNTKTDQVIAKIIKIRLRDLHIYNPCTDFDWRVSVSLEVRYEGETNSLIPAEDAGRARNGRGKDRMSYSHQGIRIDLTQVTMSKEADETGKGLPEKELEHELELEMPTAVLKEEASKLPGDGEGFKSLTRLFVDDVRMATRQFPQQ